MQYEVWSELEDESQKVLIAADTADEAACMRAYAIADAAPADAELDGVTLLVRSPIGQLLEVDVGFRATRVPFVESVYDPEVDTAVFARAEVLAS